jgi:hypothetical protein
VIPCDCCGRPIVEKKSKGIGYLCDDCFGPYTAGGPWDDGFLVDDHYPVCPFKAEAKP